MVKIASIALALSMVLWVFFYIPKQLRQGRGAKLRYIIFSALVLILAAVVLKVFL